MADQPQTSADKISLEIDADLEDLIPGFLERRQADLQTFHAALSHQDFAQIRQLAHTLKGSGGGYGFDRLSEISLQIELAAEASAEEKLISLLTELADYLERVEPVYV